MLASLVEHLVVLNKAKSGRIKPKFDFFTFLSIIILAKKAGVFL